MKKIQLKKTLLSVTLMIYGNTPFAQEINQESYLEGVKRSIQDGMKQVDNHPTLNKGLQQMLDTHTKDEATRKRECARFAALKKGKLGPSPDTAKKSVNEIISGKRKFSTQSRLSGESDVWKKYRGLVRKLERSLSHKGSFNSLDKNELDQVVLNHDTEWKETYKSLKDSVKIDSTHKPALERANENHRKIMSILQDQKRDRTILNKIRPYLRKIKQDLISFPDFTLADKNAKIHSKLSRFQTYFGKQTNMERSQIDAMLAEKRRNAMERAKEQLRSASGQKQLNEQYQAIATINERLLNPLSGIIREELDCD